MKNIIKMLIAIIMAMTFSSITAIFLFWQYPSTDKVLIDMYQPIIFWLIMIWVYIALQD